MLAVDKFLNRESSGNKKRLPQKSKKGEEIGGEELFLLLKKKIIVNYKFTPPFAEPSEASFVTVLSTKISPINPSCGVKILKFSIPEMEMGRFLLFCGKSAQILLVTNGSAR